MIVQLKRLRNIWLAGILLIIVLAFTGPMEAFWFFWLFFWTILVIGTGLYILLDQIRCPTCNVQLLSRAGIKSPEKCYNCGRPLNDKKKPPKRDIANELVEKHGDERAAKTDWQPIQTEIANFDTHKLRIDKKGQAVFKATLGNSVFSGVFLFFGFVGYTLAYIATYGKGIIFLLAIIVPLLFVIVGIFLAYQAMPPIGIDLKSGRFTLGWGANNAVLLHEIKAVQLLTYRSSHIINVQLNLVLTDHSRKSVVTYYRVDKALKDADLLARQLGVKLWNGLEE